MSRFQGDNTGEQHIEGVTYVQKDSREFMQAFDVLPPAVRRAISEASYDFDPSVAVRYMRAGMSAAEIVEQLEAADASYRALAYEQKGARP